MQYFSGNSSDTPVCCPVDRRSWDHDARANGRHCRPPSADKRRDQRDVDACSRCVFALRLFRLPSLCSPYFPRFSSVAQYEWRSSRAAVGFLRPIADRTVVKYRKPQAIG